MLRLVNRPGNRPSHEGAAAEVDRAPAVPAGPASASIVLRGDTDFSQTEHLDRWHARPACPLPLRLRRHAQPQGHRRGPAGVGLAAACNGRPGTQVKTQPRQRPDNVKEPIVRERGFENLPAATEEVAEFDYRPTACRKTYRMVVVRKNISREKGELRLSDEVRYFFYITNDRASDAADVVFEANDRCNQENLLAQLKGGVHQGRSTMRTL